MAIGQWLGIEYIDRGFCDRARLQRIDQSGLIYDRTARRIH
jgi:hypothetical protein